MEPTFLAGVLESDGGVVLGLFPSPIKVAGEFSLPTGPGETPFPSKGDPFRDDSLGGWGPNVNGFSEFGDWKVVPSHVRRGDSSLPLMS